MTDEFVRIRGERVLLRDPQPEDVEARVRWRTVEIAWGEWDAPWEGNEPVPPERIEGLRRHLREQMAAPLPRPRTQLWIERIGGPLLGWVNRYHDDPAERSTWVGIDICESAYWGQGLGTEALRLWLSYLLSELRFPRGEEASFCPVQDALRRVRLGTWSGNLRMIRCAEKCRFVLVDRRVGVREVRGERYDAVEFALLC